MRPQERQGGTRWRHAADGRHPWTGRGLEPHIAWRNSPGDPKFVRTEFRQIAATPKGRGDSFQDLAGTPKPSVADHGLVNGYSPAPEDI